MTKIAVLGWGSLLWDQRYREYREFDTHHGAWEFDGPTLKLEFSRKSASRLDALTLVIDAIHGEECKVAYALSKRRTVEKAVSDLQTREGTGRRSIGCAFTDGSRRQGRDADSVEAILRWAQGASLDAVLWTDLRGDFGDVPKNQFVEVAVNHVQHLPAEAKALAAEYVWRAPDFIATPVRSALQAEPWFKKPCA
jgi:hypothetical protein